MLVQQVRRNEKRFPADFMFQLSTREFSDLKSQSVISSGGHGGRRKPPLVFTEQGIAMLSGILRSERAIAVNIEIMRVFVELRRVASSYAVIEKRLEQIERKLGGHDEQLIQIFKTLRQLISPPPRPKQPVGFRLPETTDSRVKRRVVRRSARRTRGSNTAVQLGRLSSAQLEASPRSEPSGPSAKIG